MSPGVLLLHFMMDTFDVPPLTTRTELLGAGVMPLKGSETGTGQVLGFEIKTALRIAAMQVLATGPIENLSPRTWLSPLGCHDPYQVAVTGAGDHMSLHTMLRFFGIISDDQEPTAFNAETTADFARQLTMQLNLAGVAVPVA